MFSKITLKFRIFWNQNFALEMKAHAEAMDRKSSEHTRIQERKKKKKKKKESVANKI